METVTRRAVLVGACATCAVGTLAACGSAGTAPAPGTPLATTADIPVGGGKVLAEDDLVIVQPVAGAFAAYSATCTHSGCTVGDVAGGTINCPCHGSQYAVADGSVVKGPAPRPLAVKKITVNGTSITLA